MAKAAKPVKPAKPAKPAATRPAKPAKPAKPAATRPAKPSDNDDRWWDLIERSRKGAGDPDQQTEQLHELLVDELTADEIIAFDKFVFERLRDAFRWDLWEVAYIMNGGCSDDGFDYFCGWLVGKGRKHYEAALANPEHAAKGVSPGDEPFENESMFYVGGNAWEEKTGKSSDDFEKVVQRVKRSLQGEPFDEDTVYDKHPKLATKFN
jgi:hypothetical protein